MGFREQKLARVTITKDFLDDGERDNEVFHVEAFSDSDPTYTFDVYDDDHERYYRVVIENCSDEAAENTFEYFIRDVGATSLRHIRGSSTVDMTMA